MAIYDTLVFGTTATGMQLLPAGKLGIYNLTVQPLSALMISMMQIAQTEDFSIRGWFSKEVGGVSIVSGRNQVFPLPRMPLIYILYDPAMTLIIPDGAASTPVAPGNYIMNLLNLANAENILSFKVAPYTGTPIT
jgi:hypothetical protein